jgi:hypothetical protein
MNRQQVIVAALIAATASAACAPARPAADRVPVEAALAAASRARDCAAELWRAADLDPEATARLLGIPPAEVAPWGGAARGKGAVREAILARARATAEDARAARSLALLGEYASDEQVTLRRERVARSVAVASALCAAADVARSDLLAERR